LYGLERQANKDGLSAQQRVECRLKTAKPILDEFHMCLLATRLKMPPKGLLGKAIGYTLKRWGHLSLCLNFGFFPMVNNLAENTIHPFVVGRKNWLFCDTVAGAEASAGLYSLIETARANGLNPFEHLKVLFNKFPFAETSANLRLLLLLYQDATGSD